MINHHIFKVFQNTICLTYIPETVMNYDVDYVNKPEKYKCLGNIIDGHHALRFGAIFKLPVIDMMSTDF